MGRNDTESGGRGANANGPNNLTIEEATVCTENDKLVPMDWHLPVDWHISRWGSTFHLCHVASLEVLIMERIRTLPPHKAAETSWAVNNML
jgi:hypothetical protein